MNHDHRKQEGIRPFPWIIGAVLIVGWGLFCYGSFWQYVASRNPHERYWTVALIAGLSPIMLLITAGFLWIKRDSWYPTVRMLLESHTDAIDALPDSHIGLWIALAACLGLFAELMIIRLHASYFQLFAYFKNVSLLSCFLGLGIGYARGSKRPLTTPVVLPLIAIEISLMSVLRQYLPWVSTYLQNPVPEQFAFGLQQTDEIHHIATAYGFMGVVFAFNTLCFVPLGHLTSRLMMRQQKLTSYSWNLVGSLLGILLFNLLSFLWAPPPVWILLAALMMLAFLHKHVTSLLPSASAAIALIALLGVVFYPGQSGSVQVFDVYSPYQILTLEIDKSAPTVLKVNNVNFQRILDLREPSLQHHKYLQKWADQYALPYHFKPEPEDVLIVGSGTGNDVAAAIRHSAGEIDAVEIDPAILRIGQMLHPESPYQAANVNVVADDARAFIRHTDKQYDLIVYGLLDSHTLLSSASSVRLDSFVYTVEAFREARAKLKDDGMISVTFCVMRPELSHKLYLMLQDAFDGQPPIVYQSTTSNAQTFLIGDNLSQQSLPESYMLSEVSDALSGDDIQAEESTDDWPFFYMPVRKYPLSYMVMILVLLIISLLFIFRLVPRSSGGFSIPSFFLGAGFMLVETKGITELALVYGSTWIVTGAVIAAILIMGFIANLLTARIGSVRPWIAYGLLLASLTAGLFLSSANLGHFAPWLARGIATVVLTLPLLFSGFAFSSELGRSKSVAVAMFSNLLGAMLGGFLEYNSMYFGFRSLYLIALVTYGLAFLGSIRIRK